MSNLKKKISALMSVLLLACCVILPASAVETKQNVQVSYIDSGNIQVETVLIIHDSLMRAHSKGADLIQTYKSDGKVIAEVTLSATFGYDGEDAWVISADGSHVTYSGWSYGSERITESGDRARLTAKLSHSGDSSIPVSISLSCTPSGQIS